MPESPSSGARPRTARPPDGGWGWAIVASSFCIHVIIDGLTYAFGVLAAEFVDQLGSSRQLNGWIASVLVGVTLGAGPLAGVACDRFGARTVTMAGAVAAAAGFGVSYFVTRPWMFLLSISLLAGFGISLIYLPAIVCVGVYFEKRRSTAIGIAVCGSGLGIFAFGPIINYLIDEYTWRGAMLILSGIVLNCAVFGALLRPLEPDSDATAADAAEAETQETRPLSVSSARDATGTTRTRGSPCMLLSLQNLFHHHHQQRRQPRQRSLSAGANLTVDSAAAAAAPPPQLLLASRSAFVVASALSLAPAAPAGRHQTKLSLLRNRAFLLFVASNLLFNVGFDAPFLFAPDRAKQAGYTAGDGSLLLSVIGIANLIGRLGFGLVSDARRVNKPALYASALAIAGASLFFSFISSAYAFMAVYCAVFGVFVGAYITLTPAVLADMLGVDNLSDALGLTLFFQGIGVVAGPPMAGALFDHTQSFNTSYMTSGGCMILSGLVLFPLPRLLRWQAANSKEGVKVCSNPTTVEL